MAGIGMDEKSFNQKTKTAVNNTVQLGAKLPVHGVPAPQPARRAAVGAGLPAHAPHLGGQQVRHVLPALMHQHLSELSARVGIRV